MGGPFKSSNNDNNNNNSSNNNSSNNNSNNSNNHISNNDNTISNNDSNCRRLGGDGNGDNGLLLVSNVIMIIINNFSVVPLHNILSVGPLGGDGNGERLVEHCWNSVAPNLLSEMGDNIRYMGGLKIMLLNETIKAAYLTRGGVGGGNGWRPFGLKGRSHIRRA